MSGLRPFLRGVAYRSGALSLARSRLRHALTVVMFHRVIDPADPDFSRSDPTWTLSVPLFDHVLAFLQNHYAVIGLHNVMRATYGVEALPDHALLITFDDGWADNLRYAAPLLQARGLPAVLFAVPEAIRSASDCWWQEQVFAAARFGLLKQGQIKVSVTGCENDVGLPFPLDLVARLTQLGEDERDEFLTAIPAGPCHARMMLTPQELPQLAAFGIDVGLHGYSHAPLTVVPNVELELSRAKAAIAELSAGTATTDALGCPHGRYNNRVIAGAHAAGMRLIFTSDPHLNLTRHGALVPARPLGRINVEARQITAGSHRLDPAATARWLWDRECR